MTLTFTLRPTQAEIANYRGGKLGISAVPGSGKTFTLSALAAQIVTRNVLGPDQDVLIVTLVNSAVENFSARISQMVQIRGLIPNLGYRVRTLHGLAHDIVREKPSLAGLEDRFQIVDEREAEFIRAESANAWLAGNPRQIEDYLNPQLEESKREWVRRQHLPALIHDLALAFIRTCKNLALTPEALRRRLDVIPAQLPLAEMGWWVYDKYQQALRYRGAVDFDDLIVYAYKILNSDPDYLARLQYRFPFVLEDEAQDSSEMQENILRLIAGHGNWVRVGDPNQAIFETFTTANPRLLRKFIASEAGDRKELPVSGRSGQHIIDLANRLIEWTNTTHPAPACRDALNPPYIRAAEPDDPQPNPPMDRRGVRFADRKLTSEEEIKSVVASLKKWLPDHQDWTVAVLVPRNFRGFEVIEALKKNNIDYVDILASTDKTREAAGIIANILAYLSEPASPAKLSRAYEVWHQCLETRQLEHEDQQSHNLQRNLLQVAEESTSNMLRKMTNVENFIAPHPHTDWRGALGGLSSPEIVQLLEEFRTVINRWLSSVILPIDQLVLTLSQDLFTDPADLALAYKIALLLRQTVNDHPDWRFPELASELMVIAKNERRFLGFSLDDTGFDPERHRGKVVVTTMHKCKGLEWDRVYLISLNNYDFPSLQTYDRYISEKWFVRDGLNLEAEALAQLNTELTNRDYDWYTEGAATEIARADYSRERLRLLYVGITRARKELILTWNTGRQGEATPCLALSELMGWLEGR
jgi:DNA helicase-2/ATP-dependent DNA helicase PcrA